MAQMVIEVSDVSKKEFIEHGTKAICYILKMMHEITGLEMSEAEHKIDETISTMTNAQVDAEESEEKKAEAPSEIHQEATKIVNRWLNLT